ncbi:MAG: flagellar hook-basal body complex protein [Rhizobacter sp.]
MLDAFYISSIGLQVQAEQLNSVASNLANLGTPAFKRQSLDFSAILNRAPAGRSTDAVSQPDAKPNRLLHVDMTQGDLRASGRPLDVAIGGVGFIEVELPGGSTGYSRAGALQVNAEGNLSLASGQALKADIRVPNGASDVQVQTDGRVTATLSGDRAPTLLGQIELVNFSNPESLQYRGDGIFTAPETGGEPIRARPGEEGMGQLLAGNLEGSNVNMVDEMVSMMLIQRVYELNSRVAQAADEMMGMSNNLRRG